MPTKIKIRSMIRARPGYTLISCDLSQAESWIVAFLANEENMKRSLMYGDIHSETAGNALFNNNPSCPHEWVKQPDDTRVCKHCNDVVTVTGRYIGKRWNHASAYRMGPERATQVVNKDSDKAPYVTITVKEAKEFSRKWHEYYNLKVWWSEIEQRLSQTRSLTTTYGRRRIFYGAWGPELWKEATAFEPQSTVADHFNGMVHPELGIVGGLREVHRKFVVPNHIYLINQAHDSLMAEVPEKLVNEIAPQVVGLLKRPLIVNGEEFTIPVDCEVGERWGELEKFKVA